MSVKAFEVFILSARYFLKVLPFIKHKKCTIFDEIYIYCIFTRVRETVADPEIRYVYFEGDMDSLQM